MVAAFEAERSQSLRLQELLSRKSAGEHHRSLDEYLDTELPRALEACATNAGMIEACRNRGIDGLREVRKIALRCAPFCRSSTSEVSIIAAQTKVPRPTFVMSPAQPRSR